MALFSERASMLEVQNRALIKSAGERTQRISKLECELDVLKAEAERLKAEVAQREAEVAQLKLEREFYCKRALAFEQHNHKLTETATEYSLWGQKLERELARIDPNGSPGRRFGAHDEA